jgi:hypothetical protein
MTCYFRHIQNIFKKIGLDINKTNKREIDRVIHKMVGVNYKNCSATWREVKKRIVEDENEFVYKLNKALAEHL